MPCAVRAIVAEGHACVVTAVRALSLVRVAGVPLVVRNVACARRAGFSEVVVLADDTAAIGRALTEHHWAAADVEVRDRLGELPADTVTIVAPDALVDVNALRAEAARAALHGRGGVTLVTGGGAAAMVSGDASHVFSRFAGRALQLDDCLALLASRDGDGARQPSGVARRIVDPGDVAAAELALCAQMRAQSAATDGYLARLDRRVSCLISRWVARHTRLRPNHLTAIGTAIGLASAWALARGTYAGSVIGAVLFVVAAIVDGCDGEVARLTFRESRFGQILDVTTDNLVHLAIFVGLAVGVHRADPGGHHLVLAALLLSGFALDGALSYYFLVVRPQWRSSTDAGVRQRVLKGLEALMNRDFAYVLLLLAVVGRLQWFLWAAAIGSYVFAAAFVVFYARGEA